MGTVIRPRPCQTGKHPTTQRQELGIVRQTDRQSFGPINYLIS